MRMPWLFCIVALMGLSTAAQAQTADELVAKNLEARGGLDKIQAIKTLKLDGKLRVGGQFELSFVEYKKAPDSVRDEATLQGLTQVQAWDGQSAWQISPFQGRRDPEQMSSDDARSLADEASIGGPLVNWQAQGSTLSYQGTEDIDGTQAPKLKVALKNGDVVYVYLDPDHYLIIRTVLQQTVRGTHVETVTDYGDYERINGVYFPFQMSAMNKGGDPSSKQQVSITKAVANMAMADSLFAFPGKTSASTAAGAKP